ncbi:MAG TPA: cation transporter [Gaiellaceae bacterium]|nr:cation transporter [Gaiellaceae bacterium]
MPALPPPLPHRSPVRSAIRLSLLTIAWNLVAGCLALAAALTAGSLSLGGFGLNTVIDLSASVILVWRFWKDAADPRAAAILERRAERAIAVAMLGVVVFLAVQGLHSLTSGSHPETSAVGLGVTIASVVLLPWLSHAKAQVAARIPSRALRADAILTGASAALAALTLAAILANSLAGWWWADAAAALTIAAVLVVEVARAAAAIVRGRPSDR